MRREALRGFLQVGFFILVAGLLSALLQPRESPEFIISICAGAMGLVLVVGSIVVWRIQG